jgi:hypothetical protein
MRAQARQFQICVLTRLSLVSGCSHDEPVCSPAESTRIATVMRHATELGIQIASSGSTERLQQLVQET